MTYDTKELLAETLLRLGITDPEKRLAYVLEYRKVADKACEEAARQSAIHFGKDPDTAVVWYDRLNLTGTGCAYCSVQGQSRPEIKLR